MENTANVQQAKPNVWLLTGMVITGFVLYYYGKYLMAYGLFGLEQWRALSVEQAMSALLALGLLLALALSVFVAKKPSLAPLGLQKGFAKGLIYACACVMPMLLGLAFSSSPVFHEVERKAYRAFVLAGFGEELMFRAFLFGLLFYYGQWGFMPAAAISGLFFGMGHLYQAEGQLGQSLAVFAFTFFANMGFCWFYYCWNSLWLLVFLHGAMDFVWDFYAVSSNVTGSGMVNLFRFSTLGLCVFFCYQEAKKSGRLEELKEKLWWQKNRQH